MSKEQQMVELFLNYIVGRKYANVSDIELLFHELSRREELVNPIRDMWGNWDFSYGTAHMDGKIFIPWVDQLVRGLFVPNKEETVWPEGKKFAVCLTHDVDSVPMKSSFIMGWRAWRKAIASGVSVKEVFRLSCAMGYRILKVAMGQEKVDLDTLDFKRWLDIERQYGFHSTFFFFPSAVSKPHLYDCLYVFSDLTYFNGRFMTVADMMCEIAQGGWEIGLHGSIYSATEAGLLYEQKRQIEMILGHEIISTRQHWLKYDVAITPKIQAKAGFLVDSTQGFNRSIGFRAGTSFPYPCWDHIEDEILPIWEVPQHIMDGALFTPNALEYNEDLAIRHCLRLMDEVEKVGGCLTLSWHPNHLNIPTYWNVYDALLKEAYRRDAWGCSVGELYNWWMSRG